jgi:hypothetical protein
METIYESNIHSSDLTHNVLILKGSQHMKLKMTYECWNGYEWFEGELFVGHKWEHFFKIADLGAIVDRSMYKKSEIDRKNRCIELQTLGIKFYENVC